MKKIKLIDICFYTLFAFIISFAVYDGLKTKHLVKEEVVNSLNEKGFNVEKIDVFLHSGKAVAYTGRKIFFVDTIYGKNFNIYEKKILN